MKADLVLRSKCIFDSTGAPPFAGCVAIGDGKILSVVNEDKGETWDGEAEEIRDLGEKTLMPGFHDSHTHILMAGMYKIYANLADARSEEDAVAMLAAHDEKLPQKDYWVYGFGWYHIFWEKVELPTRHSLDKVFPDRPVILINSEAHGAWVNTKALELAGVTRDTPDPFGGEIVRDENGDATGYLYESATGLVGKVAFDFTPEQEMRIVRKYMEDANRYGITATNDMMPYFHGNMGHPRTYRLLEQEGAMTVRVHLAPDLIGDMDESERWRSEYTTDKLKVNLMKQFLDGVPTAHTALMLQPYADDPASTGYSLTDVDAIARAVPEAHRRGFSVRLHACGNKSARMALDYYEEAIRLHGKNECRHAIEHCELIDPADIPRFGALGVIPSVQPEHIALTQTYDGNPYRTVLGEALAGTAWAYRDLMRSAGVLALGSDCPVVDNNPFLGIFRGINRVHNDGKPEGGWNPAQKLTLTEVLTQYTYGSAYAVSREEELGTLAPGKFADLAVLDRNLFDTPPEDLLKPSVFMTVMDGRIVYEKED